MANETPQSVPPAVLGISYSGDTRSEAEDLRVQLESAGARVGEPLEIKETDAKLGAEEIIVTIIASAALKAVVEVAFEKLSGYLTRLIEDKGKMNKKLPNVQVLVKKSRDDHGKRELLSLKVATSDSIKKFIDNVSDATTKAIDSALEH